VAVALLPVPARGQAVLTLESAVADALARNPSILASRAHAGEAAARFDGAVSGFYPRVVLSEAWQRGNAPVFVFGALLSSRQFTAADFAIDALNHPDPTGFFHGVAAVEQLVFDGGRTSASRDAAASHEVAATAQSDAMVAVTVLDVTRAYGRILSAEANLAAAHAAVEAATEDVARAERRRDAGTVTEADVLSLAVHLATSRQRVLQATADAAIARADLNRLRGAPIAEAFAVQEPPPAAAAADDPARLVAEAASSRPEMRAREAGVALADAGRRQARAAWWPQVAAQAGYQFDGTSFADRSAAWVVGGEVRWSFSTGGAERAAERAAAAAGARARAARDEARAAVEVEVFTALRRLESAEARERLARVTVLQARESQRITRDRYEVGMAGAQDVLGAAAALLEAETSRVAAIVDRLEAHAALNRAVGRRP
jgi:outer membrane protein TolC